MDKLATLLALNGVAVMVVSLLGGLLLYRALLRDRNAPDWHLLHAGGSARGIMLIALAATIHLPALSLWELWLCAVLVIFFVWTSVLAMAARAVSGERGFGFSGSTINKFIFVLYALGTVAVFTGFAWLGFGLLKAVLQ